MGGSHIIFLVTAIPYRKNARSHPSSSTPHVPHLQRFPNLPHPELIQNLTKPLNLIQQHVSLLDNLLVLSTLRIRPVRRDDSVDFVDGRMNSGGGYVAR
jgi:hypothetical protein